jgi:hypothetical protein
LEQATGGIPNLAKAMAAAFADIDNVVRNASNPFFKSTYADLAAVLNTVRPVFAKHGLAVVQAPGPIVEGNVTLTTILLHSSGDHLVLNGQVPIAPQVDKKTGEKVLTPQMAGSAISYLRRYALAAVAGIAQIDDDANEASGRGKAQEMDATPDEILSRIEASGTYEDIVKLEDYVKATGDEKVVAAFVARRRDLKSKKATK